MTARARDALLLAALTTAATAPSASARAGGGSAHFFGGGGGHGFGGFGHGLHFFGFGGGAAIGVLVAVILVVVAVAVIVALIGARRYRRRRRERERQVELAAAEAAEDDPDFAADVVRSQAEALFRDIQAAWDARDEERLARIIGPELMVEWRRRLADLARRGWHNRVRVDGAVGIELSGLVNREADEEDRVVVRVSARLLDYVEDRHGRRIERSDSSTDITSVHEYWTLGKRGGRWTLASIESDAEGRHQLDEALVASPWSDERRLHDEALVEGAVADKALDGYRAADLAVVDFDADARSTALDLSLADGRFAPDVLEAAARRAVDAWAEAIDGDDAPLEAVAAPTVVRQLLHPRGERTRLVVRGPQVRAVRIAALETAADPPRMTIECELRGRRYLEDRDTTAVLAGSQSAEVAFTERWTLALDGPDDVPWRIVAVAVPATS